MSTTELEAKQLIQLLGGNAKTAALCEVTRSAVSQWVKNGIPRAQLRYIKAVRPDVFSENQSLRRRCSDHAELGS